MKCSSYDKKQPCSCMWLSHQHASENLLKFSVKPEAHTSVPVVRWVGICMQQGPCGSRLGSVYSQPFAWNLWVLLGFKKPQCASELYFRMCIWSQEDWTFFSLLEQALKYIFSWRFGRRNAFNVGLWWNQSQLIKLHLWTCSKVTFWKGKIFNSI